MSPDLFLLVTMVVEGSYLVEVAVKMDLNEFQNDYYLEEENKVKIRNRLKVSGEHHGPIVAVKTICSILS